MRADGPDPILATEIAEIRHRLNLTASALLSDPLGFVTDAVSNGILSSRTVQGTGCPAVWPTRLVQLPGCLDPTDLTRSEKGFVVSPSNVMVGSHLRSFGGQGKDGQLKSIARSMFVGNYNAEEMSDRQSRQAEMN